MSKRKLMLIMCLGLLLSPVCAVPAWAGGGGTTGGGKVAADPNNPGMDTAVDLLPEEFDPNQQLANANAQSFDPTALMEFQTILMPHLQELKKKLPLAPQAILNYMAKLQWKYVNQPVGVSHDLCAALSNTPGTKQAMRQLDGVVAVDEYEFKNNITPEGKAAMLLHETLERASGKDDSGCVTPITEAVYAVFNSAKYTADQLQQKLKAVSPDLYFATISDQQEILSALKPYLDSACKEADPNQQSLIIPDAVQHEMFSPAGFQDFGFGNNYYAVDPQGKQVTSSNQSQFGMKYYGPTCKPEVKYLRDLFSPDPALHVPTMPFQDSASTFSGDVNTEKSGVGAPSDSASKTDSEPDASIAK